MLRSILLFIPRMIVTFGILLLVVAGCTILFAMVLLTIIIDIIDSYVNKINK